MMARAALLILVVGATATTTALGQPDSKVPRIGFLQADARDPLFDAFRNGLHELGYIEGKTVVIEPRWADGQFDRLPALSEELVGLKVDVIVTSSTPATLAAKNASSKIPIVIAGSADPVASGIVTSLAHPGGNITGLTLMLDEIAVKRLELLKEVVPRMSRACVFLSAKNPVYSRMVERMQRAAPSMDVRLGVIKVDSPGQLEGGFAHVKRSHCDALYVFEDPVFRSNSARIVAFAAKARLPAIYGGSEFVNEGGMMSYGPSHADMFRRAAGYVDKILKGAKPGDLPIEQPTKFELIVSLRTTKALGLTVPESILLRADEVIR